MCSFLQVFTYHVHSGKKMYSARALGHFKVYYESATKNDLVIKITQFQESPITIICEIEVHEKNIYGRVNSKTRATQVIT